jgi:hypothetical protein
MLSFVNGYNAFGLRRLMRLLKEIKNIFEYLLHNRVSKYDFKLFISIYYLYKIMGSIVKFSYMSKTYLDYIHPLLPSLIPTPYSPWPPSSSLIVSLLILYL